MRHTLRKAVIAGITLACCIGKSYAVNGAYDFGFSEITRGMAGAGSALPQDSIISAINPAGLTRVKKQLDLGAVVYIPTMYYDANSVASGAIGKVNVAPGRVDSKVPFFFLPDFGVNLPIDDKSDFGISLYSLGGFGAKWVTSSQANVNGNPSAGALGDGTLRSDLKQAVTSFTYARKFLKHSSFGVSFLIGLQALRANGAQNLSGLSKYGNNVSGKGTDYSIGAGAKVGFLFGLLHNLDLAIAYQPKILMTKFHKYKGLFPNAGEFDMPAFGNIGLAWHIKKNLVLAADLVKIWFKDIPAYGRPNDKLVDGTCTTNSDECMGGSPGAGFGWNNALIFKIGAQWAVTPKTTLRAGYNRSNQILNSDYATENLITPGALARTIWTLGLSHQFTKKDTINTVFVLIPKQSLKSLNKFANGTQYVTITMKGVGIGVSWSRALA